MLRFDCYDFYKLGLAVHPLTIFQNNIGMREAWAELYQAKVELNFFFTIFPLKTCRTPAQALFKVLDGLVPEDLGEMKLDNEDGTPRNLGFLEVSAVREAAKEFETVLKAELSGWDSLFVSQKGAFSTADLISQAEVMVPESSRAVMSPESIADFRQAGMCLAFNLNTAAAFHAARSTESVIRFYYKEMLETLPSVKTRNWGAYFRNLSNCPEADKKVLGWLKHLTDEYRNPVFHPDEMLNPDTALEFVTACVALITAIARALPKKELLL